MFIKKTKTGRVTFLKKKYIKAIENVLRHEVATYLPSVSSQARFSPKATPWVNVYYKKYRPVKGSLKK